MDNNNTITLHHPCIFYILIVWYWLYQTIKAKQNLAKLREVLTTAELFIVVMI